MTNPASTRRVPARTGVTTPHTRIRRSRLARLLPIGVCLIACILLGASAAVEGQGAALVLVLWVAVLVGAGMWLTVPRGRRLPEPVLVLADLDGDGELIDERRVRVVATPAAMATLRARPRG
jgi:hypothetical protein